MIGLPTSPARFCGARHAEMRRDQRYPLVLPGLPNPRKAAVPMAKPPPTRTPTVAGPVVPARQRRGWSAHVMGCSSDHRQQQCPLGQRCGQQRPADGHCPGREAQLRRLTASAVHWLSGVGRSDRRHTHLTQEQDFPGVNRPVPVNRAAWSCAAAPSAARSGRSCSSRSTVLAMSSGQPRGRRCCHHDRLRQAARALVGHGRGGVRRGLDDRETPPLLDTGREVNPARASSTFFACSST